MNQDIEKTQNGKRKFDEGLTYKVITHIWANHNILPIRNRIVQIVQEKFIHLTDWCIEKFTVLLVFTIHKNINSFLSPV